MKNEVIKNIYIMFGVSCSAHNSAWDSVRSHIDNFMFPIRSIISEDLLEKWSDDV